MTALDNAEIDCALGFFSDGLSFNLRFSFSLSLIPNCVSYLRSYVHLVFTIVLCLIDAVVKPHAINQDFFVDCSLYKGA